ncbi:hypothetical protein [Streptomyces sp. NPDC005476]|uniref:hypothetical protein n=1 Tax=Streptomyces sp. NPDC005476 TaxID=3156882 RepID=UPI003456F3AF
MPTIAIIGAGPGMGLAIARTFGSRGFDVALSARTKEKLQTAAYTPRTWRSTSGSVGAARKASRRQRPTRSPRWYWELHQDRDRSEAVFNA